MRARAYKNALWGRITSTPDENGVSMLDSRREQAQPVSHSEHSRRKEREWLNQFLMLKRSRMREGATQPSLLWDFSRREKERLNYQRSKRG